METPLQVVIARNTILLSSAMQGLQYLPKRSKPPAFHIPNSVNSWEVWGSFHPPNPNCKKAALSKLCRLENTSGPWSLSQHLTHKVVLVLQRQAKNTWRLDPILSTLFMKQGSQFRKASHVLSLAPERWSEVLTTRERQSCNRILKLSPLWTDLFGTECGKGQTWNHKTAGSFPERTRVRAS